MKPTIKYLDEYGEIIASEIEAFFYGIIYAPLIGVINEEIPGTTLTSSISQPEEEALLRKIRSGEIIYDGEYFLGKMDARSSKIIRDMGGKWDAQKKAFRVGYGKLTSSIKVAISTSRDKLERVNAGLKRELGRAEAKVDAAIDKLKLDEGLDRIIGSLQTQTIKAMDAIGVKYTLTHGQKETLKKDYTNNIKLYIRQWTDEHVKTLRKKVEINATEGYRFTRLQDMLKHDYGTSQAKAKFLARQETSLFMSKFRRERFKGAGVDFYLWSTSKDGRVRADHKKLDGKIFQFGDPPIVDSGTQTRAEPGEYFGCRCVAYPVTKSVHKVGSEWREID